MDVIKELKNNLAEFEQLSTEAREMARRIGKKEFYQLHPSGVWFDSEVGEFRGKTIYQLQCRYEPEPEKTEYIDYEIERYDDDRDRWGIWYPDPRISCGKVWRSLGSMPSYRPVGYRFPNGAIQAFPMAYRDEQGCYYVGLTKNESLANFTVIHATAVVFLK